MTRAIYSPGLPPSAPFADLLNDGSFDGAEEPNSTARFSSAASSSFAADAAKQRERGLQITPTFDHEFFHPRPRVALPPLPPLTEEQERGIDKLYALLTDPTTRGPFALSGPAGTGKSMLTRALDERLRAHKPTTTFSVVENGVRASYSVLSVTAVAPTHKAKRRLAEAIGRPASTVHTLPYAGAEENEDDTPPTKTPGASDDTDDTAQTTTPPRAASKSLTFRKRADHAPTGDFVFLDEASMVNNELRQDLESSLRPGVKVLAIGDHCQLPPVEGTSGYDLEHADVMLTRVHRQAADNPILACATQLRTERCDLTPALCRIHGLSFQHARYGDVAAMYAARPDLVTIVGTNRTRLSLNAEARAALGFPSMQEGPQIGERVIALGTGGGLTNSDEAVVLGTSPGPEIQGQDHPWHLQWVYLCLPGNVRQTVLICLEGWAETDPKVAGRVPMGCYAAVRALGDRSWVLAEDAKRIRACLASLAPAYAITVHKCVHPDTLVETTRGLERAGALAPTGTIATAVGAEPYEDFVRYPEGPQLTFRLTQGFHLTVTPDHRMEVWDPATGAWLLRRAADVRVGALFRLRLGVTVEPAVTPTLPPAPEPGDVREVRHSIPAHMTPTLARFLGLFIADGTLYQRGFRLLKADQEVVEDFAEAVRDLFAVQVEVRKSANGHAWYCEVNSSFIARWLRTVGGLAPNNKAVPSCVLAGSSAIHAAFLRGLFADGFVNVKGGTVDHVGLRLNEVEILDTAQVMLLRLGVVGARAQYRQPSLSVYGAAVASFRDRIGMIGARGRTLAAARIPAALRWIVPITAGEAQELKSVPSVVTPSMRQYAHARGYVSRHTAQQLRGTNLDSVAARAVGWHFAPVVSIEPAQGPSVCVAVPSTGTFLQNGQSHGNSQGSQYARGVVELGWAPGDRSEVWRSRYTALTRFQKKVVCVSFESRRW